MLALDFAQFVFLGAEEAWVFEGIAHAGHSKDLQAHVNANFLTRRRQRRRFPLARDGHKPLAGRRAANRRGLRRASRRRWAMSFTSPILERMSRLPLAVSLTPLSH